MIRTTSTSAVIIPPTPMTRSASDGHGTVRGGHALCWILACPSWKSVLSSGRARAADRRRHRGDGREEAGDMRIRLFGPVCVMDGDAIVVVRGAKETACCWRCSQSTWGESYRTTGILEELWGDQLPANPANAQLAEAGARAQRCEALPPGVVPADDAAPVATELPILWLTGDGDPQGPPATPDLGPRAAAQRPLVVVPAQQHVVGYSGLRAPARDRRVRRRRHRRRSRHGVHRTCPCTRPHVHVALTDAITCDPRRPVRSPGWRQSAPWPSSAECPARQAPPSPGGPDLPRSMTNSGAYAYRPSQ